MKGDPLSDQDHIFRYYSTVHCTENGQVTGTACQFLGIDEYLSVNW